MTSSAIVAMIVINLLVMGGFIYFLRIAIKAEKKKGVEDHLNPKP